MILNGTGLEDLDDAVVSEYKEQLYSSDLDRLILIESEQELTRELSNMYCCFFRFYHSFKKDTRYIWIGGDKVVPYFAKRFDGCFLGEWDENTWEDMKRDISKYCERQFVVRKVWLENIREGLIRRRMMKKVFV